MSRTAKSDMSHKAEDIKIQRRAKEKQLDKIKHRFNQTIAQNKQLRDQIDKLRMEKARYEKISSNLVMIFFILKIKKGKQLKERGDLMKETIENAEKSYIRRRMATINLEIARKKALKEKEEFDREWKEIEAKIEESKNACQYQGKVEENKVAEIEKEGRAAIEELKKQETELRQKVEESIVIFLYDFLN